MNTTPRFGGSAQVHVKNIPASLNTIAHLNNHFTRFGTLVNVQVSMRVIFDRFSSFPGDQNKSGMSE